MYYFKELRQVISS